MIKHDTPVLIKSTHSKMLNALPMLNNSLIFVTNQNLDESTDYDYEPVEHKEEDNTSSKEEQKLTAVIAIIDTATEDQASGHEHSKRCRHSSKLLFTHKIRVLLDSGSMEIFGSTEKELPNAFPILNGRWQSLTYFSWDFPNKRTGVLIRTGVLMSIKSLHFSFFLNPLLLLNPRLQLESES